MAENRTALIIGATGLVGRHCLEVLLAEPRCRKVIALSRRPLASSSPKLSQIVVDFDKLDDYKNSFITDDVYCTIGTTIRHAGSKEAFRKVDYEYPLRVAQLAHANGARRMSVITAIGANPSSRVFYLRVKGELEAALTQLSFEALHFFRPAWLVGKREETRFREKFGIAFAQALSPLFIGKWKNYRSTEAKVVARAMVNATLGDAMGVQVYKTTDIWKLAGSRNGR